MSTSRLPDLRTIGTAARDVLESSWSGTQRAGLAARDRAAEAVERTLNGIFDEPYDVPDAATARRMIADASTKKSSVVWPVVEGLALYRLTRWITRFSRFGVSTAVIAVAPSAVSGIRQAMERGVAQLRVLASFLAVRARAEGVPLDPALVRAATIEAYLDPHRVCDLRYAGGRAGRAIAARWAKDAAAALEEPEQRMLAEARVEAVERLDLRGLEQRWQNR